MNESMTIVLRVRWSCSPRSSGGPCLDDARQHCASLGAFTLALVPHDRGTYGHQPGRDGNDSHEQRCACDRRACAAGRLPRAHGDAVQAGRQGDRGAASARSRRKAGRPGGAGRREYHDGPPGGTAWLAGAAASLCRQRQARDGNMRRPDLPCKRGARAKGGRPGAGRRPGCVSAAQFLRLAGREPSSAACHQPPP